ncbi:MAG: hypothetical protein LH618_15050, partial [Saprospiraceae bacterium]|nr:hypothetical protein [Saprospiraceae bacterium]
MFLFSSTTRSNSGLGCLVMGVLGAVVGFILLRGLYTLLLWVAPVLLVLALIIRWQVFPATLKNWLKTLQTKPLIGILQAAFAILGFPFFALYMFLLAIGGNKVEQLRDQFQQPLNTRPVPEEEFVDFEEIESRPKGEPRGREPIEPPIIIVEEAPKPRQNEPKKPDNPY